MSDDDPPGGSPLPGFTERSFTHDGATRRVFRRGSGPAVVVVHEVPGITPAVAAFGRRVADAGMTAVLPSLFGEPGRPPGVGYIARSLVHGCVSREFTTWATGRTSPAVAWLRALARQCHDECGGPGVGAVGMCFTGGFALAMAAEATTVAPVLSQPSLPFPVGRRRSADLGVSPADLAAVRTRTDDGTCVMGLRFSHDSLVPARRFERLREELGDGFLAVEIDSSPGNSEGIRRRAHSVLTEDLVDEPGHSTRAALDEVLRFLGRNLQPRP